MRLIQISDSHLGGDPAAGYRGVDVRRHFEAVLAEAGRQHPQAVLVSGDVSEDGSAVSYRWARARLDALDCPWAWLPGNHDNPTVMAGECIMPARLEWGGWQVLLLDSVIEGEDGGRLGMDQLGRLKRQLDDDKRPALVALHHPPVSVNSDWMDAIGLADRGAFWRTLSPFGQVRGVLAGHVHHAFETDWGDVPVLTVPAVSMQFLPGSDTFALDVAARPGYRLLELSGSGHFTSRVVRVDTH